MERNFWNSVIEVHGPLPHQIKRINLVLDTTEKYVTTPDLNHLITRAILMHAEHTQCNKDDLSAVVYGPFYIGEMTKEQFSGVVKDDQRQP
jgi:hypothetical protein